LFLMIWLLGFAIATALFTFFFLYASAGMRRFPALIYTGAMVGVALFMGWLLGLYWPQGLLLGLYRVG